MKALRNIACLLAIAAVAATLVAVQSCGGSKKAVQVIPEVAWAKSRPNLPSYYVGIGQANKVGTPNEYMQTAKQNALADMASDISINISANSVISAFETQNLFFEDYSQTVKSETQKELDGYELVDTWEDESQYWVYYRLSKAHYQKSSEEKKTAAALKSVDYYAKALQNIDNGDIRTGIVMLVKALEPIRQYFSESITVMFNGQEIFLGNVIIQKFTGTINSLTIKGPNTVDTKLGTGISQDLLTYNLISASGLPQKGFQIKANYSEKTLVKNRMTTGNDGEVAFTIDAVRSAKVQEQLTVILDLENLIKEGTSEAVLKRMLQKVTTPSLTTTINVVKPSVYVEEGSSDEDKILSQAVSRKLSALGVLVVNSMTEADYSAQVSSVMTQPVISGNYQMVQVTATVVLKNAQGAEIYRKTLDKIKGNHFDLSQAKSAAYNDAAKRIENTVIREIVEGAIKGKKVY